MKTVTRRELNQHSGRIIDEVLVTGEPVEVVTRGGESVVISRRSFSTYEQWQRLGLVVPGTGALDVTERASTPRSAEEIRDYLDSDH